MGRHGVAGPREGWQARACRGLYKLCLKRMQKALLPMCKIETRVFGLSSGLPLLRRRAGVSSQDAGLWGVNRAGGHEGSGWAGGPPGSSLLPSLTRLTRSGDGWQWRQRQPGPG